MSAEGALPLALVTWGQLVDDPGRMFALGVALLVLAWGVWRLPLPPPRTRP